MPGAAWIGPTVNRTPGQMSTVVGVVLHIQQGTEAGTEAWQRNPRSQISSHFLLPKAGGVRQMVDTADKAWCEVAGNRHWLSVECEGRSGEYLTGDQLEAAAKVLLFAHQAYRVRLATCDDAGAASPDTGGLGYHSMGGVAWGDHPDCPGRPVIVQRGLIVIRAKQLGDYVDALNPTERRQLTDIDWEVSAGIPDPEAADPAATRIPLHVAVYRLLVKVGQLEADMAKVLAALTPPAP